MIRICMAITKKISLVSSEAEVYNRLKETYELYCQIGGYPKVVENLSGKPEHRKSSRRTRKNH